MSGKLADEYQPLRYHPGLLNRRGEAPDVWANKYEHAMNGGSDNGLGEFAGVLHYEASGGGEKFLTALCELIARPGTHENGLVDTYHPPQENKTERVVLRVDPSFKQFLFSESETQGLSASDYIRRAVEAFAGREAEVPF